MAKFSTRLQAAVAEFGQLCVGIDPSEAVLVDWGMSDTAQSARDFGYEIISACEGRVGVIKPQVAFFERFGSAGFVALEEIMESAREAGLMVIADAKRGDIGSTMAGYAQAWFGDDSPLRADALTVSPYLGPSSLTETIAAAEDVQAGVFILAATSNPEAGELQRGRLGSQSVAERVVGFATGHRSDGVGVVIGATVNLSEVGLSEIRTKDLGVPILAPGFGAQGAKLEDINEIFGESTSRVLANVSRAVTDAGPGNLAAQINKLKGQL